MFAMVESSLFDQFIYNFTHNLFKPLLLFFYAGFLIPILGVKLEFPKAVYQGLTIYLLLAIGWHGGEKLAELDSSMLWQASGFMVIGFFTNTVVGVVAYKILRWTTRLRHVDAATVAGFYGSDSAGTFVTAVGVLTGSQIAFAAYMPVMLAVMEIPGCLVALYLVSRLRRAGMDAAGNMPDEAGYDRFRKALVAPQHGHGDQEESEKERAGKAADGSFEEVDRNRAELEEAAISLQKTDSFADAGEQVESHQASWLSPEMLHEVFLNPGIFLLFAGIAIGFIGQIQGEKAVADDNAVFVHLFHGFLCVFLLEMGMTASSKLKDLRRAGWQFVTFALVAPNVFATMGMLIAHGYSMYLGQPFEIGTYVLFGVLCGASSYIAVPAVQRLAIPEASPTLPLAASLGVTFSYNVTIGIPVYIMIATILKQSVPLS